MKKLSEIALIIGGQIISRVIADSVKGDLIIDGNRKTIVAKTISEGYINSDNIIINDYKKTLDKEKLTRKGDIVIKLSSPVYACLIDENNTGMLVSSFCAIIRNVKDIDKRYLAAFLNSDICQQQLSISVAGSVANILSTGKLGDLEIPIPEPNKQIEIANFYEKTIKNRILLQKIIKLESEKLSSLIERLGK